MPRSSSARWAETHPRALVMVAWKRVLTYRIKSQAPVNRLKQSFISLVCLATYQGKLE
jgi:hypothetical protein